MASQNPQTISRVLFERAPWDSIDSAYESRIPFDSPADHVDCLGRMVEAGEAMAWRIIHDGRRVGLVVAKIDDGAAREFIIVSVYCESDTPLSHEIQAFCEQQARALGCIAMRFHTVRPAAARLAAQDYGYRLSEVIMRKDLPSYV